jgi:hypothetical protein
VKKGKYRHGGRGEIKERKYSEIKEKKERNKKG